MGLTLFFVDILIRISPNIKSLMTNLV